MVKPILAAILSCSGTQLTDEEKYLFASSNPLGVTLFARNLQSEEQTIKLVQDIKNAINRDDVLIAIDEEGGRVSRLKNIYGNQFVAAEALGLEDAKYCKMHADIISATMKKLGLNVNYAPVIDKKTTPQNPVLVSRCFSSSGEKITKFAKIMASTYEQNGICPCIKHLPTHFSSQKDPHLSSLKTDISLESLKQEIFYLKSFSQSPMAMTAHIILTSIDKNLPVTMSKKAIHELLRGFLEFKGFLLSDAIDMHALQGSVVERANLSLDAGVDAICYCSGIYKDMYAICCEKRFLTEKSLIRFAKIKNIIHNSNKDIKDAHIKKQYIQAFAKALEQQYEYDATEVLNQMLKKGENL